MRNDVEENKDLQTNKFHSSLSQIVATLGFSILMIGIGLILCMPTIVIGGLLYSKDEFSLDDHSASWFGSIIYISQPVGSIVSGYIQDRFGRKRSMTIVNIPQILGWILLYYSSNVVSLYASAVVMGLSLGFMEAPVMSYIGETCEPRLRGPMSVLTELCVNVGVLLECLFGALTDWRTVCLISATVPAVAILSISLIPESPTWLICVGRISEAEKSLCWLRGWVQPKFVHQEFAALLAYTSSPHTHEGTSNQSMHNKSQKVRNISSKKLGITDRFKLLSQPKLFRPLRLVLLFFVISQTVSLLGMRPFLVKIFNDVGMPMDAHWVLVFSSVLQVVGFIVCMFTVRALGKRLITFISLSVSTISCLLLGVFLMIEVKFPWTIFIFFCLILFATASGVCPIPWILISEVFPLEGRGLASGISAAGCYLIGFLVTKTYINLFTWFDVYGTCFIYGVVGFVGFIYLYFELPETEGKTLEEVEIFFKDKYIKINDREHTSK